MESDIKIKATVSEMSEFFEQDGGVRFYKINDKRYTQADLDAMSEVKYQSERFTFSVVYRHMELDKPLSGTFTVSGLKKKMSELRKNEKQLEAKPSVLQKLNDMKGADAPTGAKKPHAKEER